MSVVKGSPVWVVLQGWREEEMMRKKATNEQISHMGREAEGANTKPAGVEIILIIEQVC